VSVLRLEADDPAVLELTGLALHDAIAIPDPPLRLVCSRCGALLARAGDTGHGPLFTSSWHCEPEIGYSVVVNGRKLSRSEAIKWRAQHDELVQRRGEPMHAPLLHGVTALLTLPADLAQDHPDLLVRCDKHGDRVLDRTEVLNWLRQAALKPAKRKVAVSQPVSTYRHPQSAPGPSRITHQSEVWRPRFDAMPLEEFDRRMSRRTDES
jgi:hypothetical protein